MSKSKKKVSEVRQALDQRGLSLQTGADLLGISRRQMAYYASGVKPMPGPLLHALKDLNYLNPNN